MSGGVRVCYAAPGHTLLATAGSVRNMLSAAEALCDWAEVTLAFRRIAEPVESRRFRVESIEPAGTTSASRDDVAARGLNPFSHSAYLKVLRDYAHRSAGSYDLVLEKGWRLSGCLSSAFAAHGVRTMLIENDARAWNEPIRSPRTAVKFLAHTAAQALAARWSRQVPAIAAETEQLKAALVTERGLDPARIHVVSLGVDHSVFRPADMAVARAGLGISRDAFVMLYVGGMDQYHNLSPLLEALRRHSPGGLELHLVGDGEYRARYEALARGLAVEVRFHGQVPHRRVPVHIAAADVCLAPYNASGFHNNEVSFSTLKIPEYMACERPVISVPSGHIRSLVTDGVTGFLFNNDLAAWAAFLARLPDRSRLAEMGRAAGPSVAHLDWRATVRRYLEIAGLGAGRQPS